LGSDGHCGDVSGQDTQGAGIMTIESAILQNVEQLPEPVKQAVLLYTEFLADRYRVQPNHGEESQVSDEKLGYGSLAGQIIMAEDFDAPLEDLQEYM
jgi:hypothetical protein